MDLSIDMRYKNLGFGIFEKYFHRFVRTSFKSKWQCHFFTFLGDQGNFSGSRWNVSTNETILERLLNFWNFETYLTKIAHPVQAMEPPKVTKSKIRVTRKPDLMGPKILPLFIFYQTHMVTAQMLFGCWTVYGTFRLDEGPESYNFDGIASRTREPLEILTCNLVWWWCLENWRTRCTASYQGVSTNDEFFGLKKINIFLLIVHFGSWLTSEFKVEICHSKPYWISTISKKSSIKFRIHQHALSNLKSQSSIPSYLSIFPSPTPPHQSSKNPLTVSHILPKSQKH